jgi:hypothetical protein
MRIYRNDAGVLPKRKDILQTTSRLFCLSVFLLSALLLGHSSSWSQYYLRRTVQLPDSTINEPLRRLAIPPMSGDVRALGMGRTRVADGNALSSFLHNPGFLGRTDRIAGSGSLIAIAPLETIDAIVFLSRHSDEFDRAFSLQSLVETFDAYLQGTTIDQQVQEKLERVAAVTRDLLENVIGDPRNPDIHTANLNFIAQMQVGHWGFSLQGYGQSGMGSYVGPIMASLLEISARTDFNDETQKAQALAQLEGLLARVIDPVTGKVALEVLPAFYSVTFADLMATAGYGFLLAESLSVGVQLKVLNRRFSAARIGVDEASDFSQNAFGGLAVGLTGVTFDVGAVYRLPSGLTVGLNLQNLIPMKTLSSGYNFSLESVQFQPDRETDGSYIINSGGDTALVAYSRKNMFSGPSTLALPFLANIGVLFPINEDWDVSFELVDIAQQESSYESYTQRFGFGLEYRLHFLSDNLHVAPRLGLENTEPSLGIGVSYRDIVALNGAYYAGSQIRARRNFALQLTAWW